MVSSSDVTWFAGKRMITCWVRGSERSTWFASTRARLWSSGSPVSGSTSSTRLLSRALYRTTISSVDTEVMSQFCYERRRAATRRPHFKSRQTTCSHSLNCVRYGFFLNLKYWIIGAIRSLPASVEQCRRLGDGGSSAALAVLSWQVRSLEAFMETFCLLTGVSIMKEQKYMWKISFHIGMVVTHIRLWQVLWPYINT